jgi:hypothetical protein
MAKEAIELYIESLKEHGEAIPTEESTLEYTIAIESGSKFDITLMIPPKPSSNNAPCTTPRSVPPSQAFPQQ